MDAAGRCCRAIFGSFGADRALAALDFCFGVGFGVGVVADEIFP